ncbi:MAG: D-alanyl-D-alanine carboxypeptidase [Methylovulum sp.]|nr:D-alanyl-D-alanine carboxypeptidase [Methylovulum sp.]
MKNVKLTLLVLMSLCLSLVSGASYSRHAAILIDADNGKVIFEQDANHAWFPASLTKVMTLYMAFSALRQGEIQLNEMMTTSSYAARQPNSKLGLRTGENLSVEEAILALITRSANDAAVVLAEHLGGNEDNFAVRMTAKAHALGMYDTHFMNATGLPHQWQVTTPRDLGLLAYRTLHDFPNYYPYFASHNFYFRGQELRGINKFTANYPGAEGMKTGFTCGSGYNLMSSAQQNGKRLIGVVMGGMTSSERYQLMTSMMDDGFGNALNDYPNKTITAIPAKFPSTPPYQLGCGHDAPRHSYAQYTPPKRHHSKTLTHSRHAHISHPSGKHKKAIRIAKNTNKSHPPSLAKFTKAHHRSTLKTSKTNVRSTSKISKLTKTIKPNKSRYHRNG